MAEAVDCSALARCCLLSSKGSQLQDGAFASSAIHRRDSRPQLASSQIVIMGMSRSGTSLTASLVASLLSSCADGSPKCWRGSAAALPTDKQNPLGYFERNDVILLNYVVLQQLKSSWTTFPDDYLTNPKHPDGRVHLRKRLCMMLRSIFSAWLLSSDLVSKALLNFTSVNDPTGAIRSAFETRAKRILSDMQVYSPWLLKDVRFARTLPLWRPLLSRPVCIVPYRHPLEVAASSMMHSSTLWRNYMLSALTAVRELKCPTLLVSYEAWFANADSQYHNLWSFLRCAGVSGLPADPPYKAMKDVVQPRLKHHDAGHLARSQYSKQMLPSTECIWRAISNKSAPIDQLHQRLSKCSRP